MLLGHEVLHHLRSVAWDQILLKNARSARKSLLRQRNNYLLKNFSALFKAHNTVHRLQGAYTITTEASPKLFFRAFHTLVRVTIVKLLSRWPTNMPTSLALDKQVAFINEYYFFFQSSLLEFLYFCATYSVFLSLFLPVFVFFSQAVWLFVQLPEVFFLQTAKEMTSIPFKSLFRSLLVLWWSFLLSRSRNTSFIGVVFLLRPQMPLRFGEAPLRFGETDSSLLTWRIVCWQLQGWYQLSLLYPCKYLLCVHAAQWFSCVSCVLCSFQTTVISQLFEQLLMQ